MPGTKEGEGLGERYRPWRKRPEPRSDNGLQGVSHEIFLGFVQCTKR